MGPRTWPLAFLIFLSGSLDAAPVLRLSNTVIIVEGGGEQTLEAFNIGDGSMSLSLSIPQEVTWLAASAGAPRPYGRIPLRFSVNIAGLEQGVYTAPVTVSDPNAVDSPQVVTVTVRVGGNGPINAFMASGTTTGNVFFPVGNLCKRDCPVATTEDGGHWLTLGFTGGSYIWVWSVTLKPAITMEPGTYRGSIRTIPGGPETYPVHMRLTAPAFPEGSPLIYYGSLDSRLAQGDLATLIGDNLSLGDSGATVLVNGAPSPLLEASERRIKFQVPIAMPVGAATVQVIRDGQPGNTLSSNIVEHAPRIVAANIRDTHLLIWATGLGTTDPAVPDGEPAPADPPAVVTVAPTVQFSGSVLRETAPEFAALAPGEVGVYQVVVSVPADGLGQWVRLRYDQVFSDWFQIR
jgi:uncharacterized protein (TIGR03437 family)